MDNDNTTEVTLPSVEFTDEQRDEFRDALFDAQLALLNAIRREAMREDSYDGPRNVARLTASLASLRALATGRGPGGWFAYAPGTPPIFASDMEIDDLGDSDQ